MKSAGAGRRGAAAAAATVGVVEATRTERGRGVDALPASGLVGVHDQVAADDGQPLEGAVEADVRRAVLVGGDAPGRQALVPVEAEGGAVGGRRGDGSVDAAAPRSGRVAACAPLVAMVARAVAAIAAVATVVG